MRRVLGAEDSSDDGESEVMGRGGSWRDILVMSRSTNRELELLGSVKQYVKMLKMLRTSGRSRRKDRVGI